MQKVKVTADKKGNVITVSEKNPEFGHIRVEQEVVQINDRGWLQTTTRSAIINGKVEDLLKTGFKDGSEIPGKIVVIESLKPFNLENPEKNMKIAGDTGVVCRMDDQPIYRQTFFTTNQNSFDELLMHTNTEEIKTAASIQKFVAQTNAEQVKSDTTL